MKKSLLLLISFTIIISLIFAGCGDTSDTEPATDNGDQTTEADPESNMTGPDEFPIVHETVTLRVFVAPEPWLGEFSDNWATQQYEDLTNVHIEWQQVGRDDVASRVNLMLASGTDLPDVFMTGINREQQVVYGEQGLFIPLNDYITEYGVRTRKMFDFDPTIEGQITAPDGNIYSLPEYNECYHCDYAQRMWINETWLENLGLEKPETTEEFYDVLLAFKENDANENGDPNDEIPLAAANGDWHGSVVPFLMNAFVYHQGMYSDRLFFDENNQIHFAPITEEWRDGLRYMRRLYEDGLMDREIFIMDSSQARQLTESPSGNQIGAIPAGHHGIFVDISIDGAKHDFGPLAPLVGPNGVRNAARFLTGVNTCFLITNAADEPEVAFRWGEGMIGDPNEVLNDRVFLGWGEEGVDWRRLEDSDEMTGLDGGPALYTPILPYGEPHNRHWGQPKPGNSTNKQRFASGVELDSWDMEFELFKSRRNYYEMYGPEIDMVIPPLFMDLESVEVIGEMRTTIRDYIDETVARFITGDLDLDTDWDMVVTTFQNMELDRFVEMIQDNYDRQYSQ